MDIKFKLQTALLLIDKYSWLIDSSVLDFFIDDHWSMFPDSWTRAFNNIEPEEFGKVLQGANAHTVFPLSFLALIKTIDFLSIKRKSINKMQEIGNRKMNPEEIKEESNAYVTQPNVSNLFLKHVKLKKRHEISLMCETVEDVASKTNCRAVVDFGCGVGHLIRTLAYNYNLKTVGLESESDLILRARTLDNKLEYSATKYLHPNSIQKLQQPRHIQKQISPKTDFHKLSEEISHFIGHKFGLVGLHPCGDLGPLLLRYFVECSHVQFICIVSCCYMKLSCGEGARVGYPLSDFVSSLKCHKLSYESREIACHAYELYCQKLTQGLFEDLRVHSFRAALERIIVKNWPQFRHRGLRSIKYNSNLSFDKYCEIATEKLDIIIPMEDIESKQTKSDLEQWKKVIIFYTCRLLLAPLIESVILMDRLVYLHENGVDFDIKAVFDPFTSPRNHILTAYKK